MQTIEINLYTAEELKEQFPAAFEKARQDFANRWDDPWSDERNRSCAAVMALLEVPTFDPRRPRSYDPEGLTGLDLYNVIRKLKRDDFYPTGYCNDRDFAEAAVSEYESGARTGRRCAWNFDTVWDTLAESEYEAGTDEDGFLDHAMCNDYTFTESGEVY